MSIKQDKMSIISKNDNSAVHAAQKMQELIEVSSSFKDDEVDKNYKKNVNIEDLKSNIQTVLPPNILNLENIKTIEQIQEMEGTSPKKKHKKKGHKPKK